MLDKFRRCPSRTRDWSSQLGRDAGLGLKLADPGTVYIITRYRDRNSSLRSIFQKMIARADHQTWPREIVIGRCSLYEACINKSPDLEQHS